MTGEWIKLNRAKIRVGQIVAIHRSMYKLLSSLRLVLEGIKTISVLDPVTLVPLDALDWAEARDFLKTLRTLEATYVKALERLSARLRRFR